MNASPATAATAVPADAVQPSLAEQLSTFGREAWAHLMQLDPSEAGINVLVSGGVIVAAVGVIWVLRRLFDRWLGKFADSVDSEAPQAERRTHKAAGVTWGLLRVVILSAALLFVISVWGIDPWAWLSAGVGGRLVRLALILVMVTALVEVAGFVIGRLIDGFARRSRDARRANQIRSLGPLLAGSIQAVLIVIGLLTFLSELGVKVGPLLASAGVVGIAVGFGAQSLVKDFLTGVFLIAEDAVSVGDNVRIADSAGTVEAMTLRTVRVRSQNGTLHIIPYSEAQVIHNRTKVFSSYLFTIPLAYSTDIDRAMEVMQEVGDALAGDPDFSALITRPFEVLGVDQLTESAVTLKAKLTTQPKAQWRVGREYNRRLKNAFDAEGIQTPFTTVQVMPPSDVATPAPVARPPEPRAFDLREDRSQS